MKKLFISCPVKGRKIEDVYETRKKMHAIAEVIFGEELWAIDSIMAREIIDGDSFESLAHHIACMKEADYFIGIDDNRIGYTCFANSDSYNERKLVDHYNYIQATYVRIEDVCPDIHKGDSDDN